MDILYSLVDVIFEVLFVEVVEIVDLFDEDLTVGHYFGLLVLDMVVLLYDFDFHVLEKENQLINHLFDLKYDLVFLLFQLSVFLLINQCGPLYFVNEEINE